LVGSRFTSATESRYAPVEGEALAVADGLEKARYFVLGCAELIIAVDHKPLLKIFGDRSLEHIPNARLRNLKEKTLRYKFKMLHVPKARHRAADAISRHPVGEPEDMVLVDDIAVILPDNQILTLHTLPVLFHEEVCHTETESHETSSETLLYSSAVSSLSTLQCITWDRIRTATTSDESMFQLVQLIESGIPEARNEVPSSLREYHQFRNHLSTYTRIE